jgi:hypothetical protein
MRSRELLYDGGDTYHRCQQSESISQLEEDIHYEEPMWKFEGTWKLLRWKVRMKGKVQLRLVKSSDRALGWHAS